MLIESPRYTREDRAAWDARERADAVWCKLETFHAGVSRSIAALRAFADRMSDGGCYCGVSWGKDSVVVADLVCRYAPEVPLVWVRVEPDFNPDCALVRDAFFRIHPQARYEEIVVNREEGPYVAHGTLDAGMRIAARQLGTTRYISGVRGQESGQRKRRMMAHGTSTANTCAPIGWWTGRDVFAQLHARGLPVHPAYACSMGGLLDRERIRVGPLGGQIGARPGDGMGRGEWEGRYYAAGLARVAR
jgi:phosphoadenosine phosphosulfate reductase